MPARRVSAEWVYPVGSPPITGGAVLLDADGRIAVVGPDARVPCPPGVASEHFDDAVLTPGLVNAHTHLELTGLAGTVTDDHFSSWIVGVRRAKELRSPEEFLAAARRGLAESLAAGVTTVAETGDTGAAAHAIVELGGRGVVYQEVFGPHPDQCAASRDELAERIDRLSLLNSPTLRLGVSPHAPYTVSADLYSAVARLARERGLPLAVHIAESSAESAFLGNGTGPFAQAWERRGIPAPDPLGDTPIEWLDRLGVLGSRTLCIHCVQATASDLNLLRSREATIVHCPRSNRRHGHGDAPLGEFLAAGIPVGLGTDSEVSVAPPDLLAEGRMAMDIAGIDAARALELATLGSARAIGLGAEIGTLEVGRWGDLVVRRVGSGISGAALADRILASGAGSVILTVVAGMDRHRAS